MTKNEIMNDMNKKAIMLITLFCMLVQGAWAQEITYDYLRWDKAEQQLERIPIGLTGYITLSGNHPDDWVSLDPEDDYVVNGNATYKVLHVSGQYGRIILKKGSTLNVKHIKLEKGSKLVIYRESSEDKANVGKLIVNNDAYSYAAGIGGGDDADGGDIEIHGGIITVHGGKKAAGIGGGDNGAGGTLVLYDGEVTATGGDYGAGIGGGEDGYGGQVYVYGGTLNAYGGEDAAGIGGGEDGSGGDTHIVGGTVKAEGKGYGAGIGGGEYGYGGNTYITGGTVIAIAGNACKGRDANCGSAIGCGDDVENKDGDSNAKQLEIPDDYMVTAGDSESNIERVFTNGERIGACRWRNFVKIEACSHTAQNDDADNVAITYSIDDDGLHHTRHCRYCNYTLSEDHADENCVCGKANENYQFTVYEPGTAKNTYVEGATTTVAAGKEFFLPYDPVEPAGYVFKGWEMNPDTNEPDYTNWGAVLGQDLKDAGSSVKAFLGQTPVKFYARYIYDLGWETIWDDENPTTGTTVLITHPDLDPWSLTANSKQLNITAEPLLNEKDEEIGTHYVARVAYTLKGFEYTYISFKDVLDPVKPTAVTLADESSNDQTLKENEGQLANVTLSGRTLYKDGSWNTLCLPFDVDDIDGTPLAGASVKTLASSTFDEGTHTLTLTFADATRISAGMPYMVKWASGDDLVNPIFEGVTISGSTIDTVGSEYVDFMGSFSPCTFTAGDNSTLYLGTNNILYNPSADRTMGACRAYLKLHNGLSVGSLTASRARVVLRFVEDPDNFGDEQSGEATGINGIGWAPADKTGEWYDLQGRRLSGEPTQKGLYIRNGKKVMK